jgi:hypothetical protein
MSHYASGSLVGDWEYFDRRASLAWCRLVTNTSVFPHTWKRASLVCGFTRSAVMYGVINIHWCVTCHPPMLLLNTLLCLGLLSKPLLIEEFTSLGRDERHLTLTR